MSVSTADISVFITLQSLYTFTMSCVTLMLEVASLLTHFQGKSAGFTMKPFESTPNKLVAARFQWQVCIGALLQEAHVVAALYTPR